jgi:hypothetical protein
MEVLKDLTTQDFVKLHNSLGRPPALGRIFSMVESSDCKSIVIEENPNEEEYKAEYNEFFKNVLSVSDKQTSTRLHFFKGSIKTVEEVLDNDPSYLGYCDLRPTFPASISTAIINLKTFCDPSRFIYLICKRKFEIPFGEKILSVEAFPYIQQDGRIIRCAQAALASISMFYNKNFTGPDFTKLTAEVSPTGNRLMPSSGMNSSQIGVAWTKLEKEPEIYAWLDKEEDRFVDIQHREQIIYRYLESGIPVLIGIDAGKGMHALVVIGHTFTPDSWMAQTKTIYYDQLKTGLTHHCSTNWIERFIVQDDNLGPYTLVLSDFLQYFGCKIITIGLPKGIYTLAEDAERFVGNLLCADIHNITNTFDFYIKRHIDNGMSLHEETTFWYEEFKKHNDDRELVLRTYLKDSKEWKREISFTESYSEYADFLEGIPLPERIWVVEISWPQIFRHQRLLCGEIIIDPTDDIIASIPTLDQAWLWMHVPGLVLRRNAKTRERETLVLQGKDTIRFHNKREQ